MRALGLALCVLLLAAGCGRRGSDAEVATFDGIRFDARLTADAEDKRNVTITVTPVAVNALAAQEAGRYEATKYCLRNYGGSDTDWTVGPGVPVEELQIVDDSITLQGRCTQR